MNAPKQRRIQVASFSKDDVSRSQLATFGAGALLVVAAAAAGWAATVNHRNVADAKGAARQLIAVANQAGEGASAYLSGGSASLKTAAALSNSANSTLVDLGKGLVPVVTAPALSTAAVGAYGSWQALSGAMADANTAIVQTTELSQALGKSAGSLSSLLKQIEGTGKSAGVMARAHESALRLYTYAEGGFGPVSIQRVDYDLRVLAADLGGSELRPALGFLEPLLATSKQAASTTMSKDQVARIKDAAMAAKAAGENLGATAVRSQAPLFASVGAAVLAAIALLVMWKALQGVMEDFGRRYARAMSQFRAGEGAHKELVTKLRLAIDRGHGEFSVSDTSPELQEIGELVGELNDGHVELVRKVREMLAAAGEGGQGAEKALAGVESQCKDLLDAMSSVSDQLSSVAMRARLASVDAAAASHAAEEAGMRSADANRVAQDSASRLEALREGLQETSKGIKRLGERTQEINGVVDSMELLSEQIGVLSLNASLEAERAGDAGAGFRLVAKEVQALARRSEQSLQRMSALVQGAQADARSAAEAVERSTSQVVAGSNVGAVSQALLVAMAPLSTSVEAMTRSIADTAKMNSDALLQADDETGKTRAWLAELGQSVGRMKAPISQVRQSLSRASSIAGAAQ